VAYWVYQLLPVHLYRAFVCLKLRMNKNHAMG